MSFLYQINFYYRGFHHEEFLQHQNQDLPLNSYYVTTDLVETSVVNAKKFVEWLNM